jgi:hypothetical protein
MSSDLGRPRGNFSCHLRHCLSSPFLRLLVIFLRLVFFVSCCFLFSTEVGSKRSLAVSSVSVAPCLYSPLFLPWIRIRPPLPRLYRRLRGRLAPTKMPLLLSARRRQQTALEHTPLFGWATSKVGWMRILSCVFFFPDSASYLYLYSVVCFLAEMCSGPWMGHRRERPAGV